MVVALGTTDAYPHEDLRGGAGQRHRIRIITENETYLRGASGFPIRCDQPSTHLVVRHVG